MFTDYEVEVDKCTVLSSFIVDQIFGYILATALYTNWDGS